MAPSGQEYGTVLYRPVVVLAMGHNGMTWSGESHLGWGMLGVLSNVCSSSGFDPPPTALELPRGQSFAVWQWHEEPAQGSRLVKGIGTVGIWKIQ